MVIFHPLVQRDLLSVLGYYEEESGLELADRFFDAFLAIIDLAEANPRRYHPVEGSPHFRRAPIPRFPFHFIYRETAYGIRVSVLRHDKRHPAFGMRRR